MNTLGGMMGTGKKIRVYRWLQPGTPHNNFGDEITVPLLRNLFGIEAIPSTMDEAELIGSGSILDSWTLRSGRSKWDRLLVLFPHGDLHVWGSGFILPDSVAHWPQRLHFHAVRGTPTARRLGVKTTLGDPGILANHLLDKRPTAMAAVGVVPHHNDICDARFAKMPKGWRLISPNAPVLDVLTAIASCELIISSSLHGLITADSFGVPCIWVRPEEQLFGNSDFKFHDYQSARGNHFNAPVPYASVFSSDPRDLFSLSTTLGRSLEEWQSQLIRAFPN